MKHGRKLIIPLLLAILLVVGCRGLPAAGEKATRRDVAMVAEQLSSPPPQLKPGARLGDYVHFALRNQPQVAAAYADWAGSVEQITVARSLPDPQLTFEFYLADTINSLMPGVMMNIPGPGKLSARAAVASAESRVKYFQFESVVLQTAFGVQKTFYPLYFLQERIRVNHQSLDLLAGLETLAQTQNEVGQATLQDVLRAQIEQEKLRTETANLEDSRRVLMARFTVALGLRADQPEPPEPVMAEFDSFTDTKDTAWLAAAMNQNSTLREFAAEIQVAEAQIAVARKDKMPDFSAGGEVDVKASPVMWNPQFSMTLPVWRDKLAAELAAAQAAKRAAIARLAMAQIALAADFAEQSYDIRAADRELVLLREKLLPRARQSLAAGQAAYRSGQTDFLNVIDDERALLNFQLAEIDAQTRRAVARAELQLIIAGVPPAGSPLLPENKPATSP